MEAESSISFRSGLLAFARKVNGLMLAKSMTPPAPENFRKSLRLKVCI
jgi:hypothetical protein